MRIAIATDWFAPRRGGIESQLSELAAGLGRRGHAVDVITSTPGASSRDGYRVRCLEAVRFPGTQVAVSPRIIGALRQIIGEGYDVVHCHVSVVSPVGYGAAFVARVAGLPTVVTFHSVLRHKRHLLRAADAVAGLATTNVAWTAVSELVASQLREAMPRTSVVVLPNGFDLGFWEAARLHPSRVQPEDVIFVSSMRLHAKKRPRQLLRAFATAAQRSRRSAVLRIIGEGPERAALERDIEHLGLNDGHARAELLGWFSPEALRAVYRGADAFVLASTRESFGIAALEAAAAGLPVIAMAEGGSREFLGPSDLLCADDDALASALARCVDQPFAGNAVIPRHRLQQYDWPNVLAQHEAVYDRVIQLNAGGRQAGVA